MLRNTKPIRKHKLARKTRASVIFFLEDKNRNSKNYLGLLGTGSNGSVIGKDLVEEYEFQCEK